MKKIAVPNSKGQVSGHFGHAPEFTIFSIQDKQIMKTEVLDNPGHKTGFLPKFLNKHGVNAVLAGGMGQRAVDIFEKNGIEVICGATGITEQVVKDFLAGELEASANGCDHDDHHDHQCQH